MEPRMQDEGLKNADRIKSNLVSHEASIYITHYDYPKHLDHDLQTHAKLEGLDMISPTTALIKQGLLLPITSTKEKPYAEQEASTKVTLGTLGSSPLRT